MCESIPVSVLARYSANYARSAEKKQNSLRPSAKYSDLLGKLALACQLLYIWFFCGYSPYKNIRFLANNLFLNTSRQHKISLQDKSRKDKTFSESFHCILRLRHIVIASSLLS